VTPPATYHIVSHTHWDREWYKSFEQFRSMLVMMVDDLLALLARDPAFACFTLDGQTSVVDDYLAVRPEKAEQLKSLITQGRILVGPWYILPDEFLVSAEATVRNLLYGMKKARELGSVMRVGYIPDSFGHIAMMPAILKGFGMDTAIVYRGFGGEPGQSTSEYWWDAPDGSRALMLHLFSNGYSAGYFHQETPGEIVARFRGLKRELDTRATTSHRLLLNGGDHHWPDPHLPATLALLRENFEGTYLHSNIPACVSGIRSEVHDLPIVKGELRFGYRYAFAVLGGVYSSRMYIKQANWRCQNLLQRYAEPLHVFARVAGMQPLTPLLRHAWRSLLQNHPHDSICGCSIDPVHREMMVRFKAVEDVGGAVITSSLESLVPYDDRASGDDTSLVLFNPSPFSRSEVVAADLRFYMQDVVVGLNPDVRVAPKRPPVQGFVLRHPDGGEIPYQIVDRGDDYDITYTKYNYPKQTRAQRYSLLVDARKVPAIGYQGLRVERTTKFPKYQTTLKSGPRFLENAQLKVEVNAAGLVTLRDKKRGLVFSGLHLMEDGGDVGDEYNYSYPLHDRIVRGGKASVKRVERGPLTASLRIQTSLRVPVEAAPDRKRRAKSVVAVPVTTTLSLTHDAEYLEIVTTVENRAKDHRLRVLFPTSIGTDTVVADSQYCLVDRKQKKYDVRSFTIEHPALVAPMQRFVAAGSKKRGLALMTDGLPEYELCLDKKRTLALTLLRSVGLLAGDDLLTRPGGKAGWHNETPDAQCPGTHTFRYALLPLSGDPRDEMETVNRANERFHLPLRSFGRKNTGELERQKSFLACDNAKMVFSALKDAEEGVEVIVRLYNPLATEEEFSLTFGSRVEAAWQAGLDEQPANSVGVRGGCAIPLRCAPHAIVTLRVRMAT
jgi:mannosylglycerate hydrolase